MPSPPPRPPAALPAGLRPVWKALRRVEARGGSRAELARRLGVSTRTLQSLLSDGRVPDLARAGTRQQRAWARTLARLADRLGGDARRWIRGAGIPWDDAIAAVVARERGRSRAAAGADPGALAPLPVGVVDLAPFSDPLPGRGVSFAEEIARRVVACLAPRARIETRRESPAALCDRLARAGDAPALGVGLFDSAEVRRRGVEVLPFPGWELSLASVTIGNTGGAAADALGPPGTRWLARDGEPAAAWLAAHHGVPAESIALRSAATPADLARDLADLAREAPGRPVTLATDEGTCLRVERALGEQDAETGPVARRVPPREQSLRLRPGLAIPAGPGPWSDLVRHAWRHDLLDAGRAEVARLWGELLHAATRRAPEAGSTVHAAASHLAVVPFATADEPFRVNACRALLRGLIDERALAESRDRDRWNEAIATAHAALAPSWRPVFDGLAWIAMEPLFADIPLEARPLSGHFCRSCSTSLREAPGPSGDYCRFCSDEHGRLRPKEEVHKLIARWMQAWQDGLTTEEARERATRYMSALPAWSEN